jgi:DNA invertase Pin-like site-specific DNA recombinase
VESLDRLSREQVLTAQSLFLSIIQAGINLVTLTDGRVYQAGKTDLADLITSLVIMSRAHEESQTKSHRIAAAWKNKRAKANQRPMTKWCPAWLALSSDRTSYEPNPERVEIVRQIFKDTASGIGMYSVTSRLNKARVETFGGPNGWYQSYIAKILSNRAVLGEFQPHVRVDGKPVPDGEAIQGYFPAIIDEELFYQAQFAKSQRRGAGAGRKGAAFTNLFSGLAKCAYCGSPVQRSRNPAALVVV